MTLSMGMINNFKSLLEKVHLADMKVLDIAGIGDVVLKTTFDIYRVDLEECEVHSKPQEELIFLRMSDNE